MLDAISGKITGDRPVAAKLICLQHLAGHTENNPDGLAFSDHNTALSWSQLAHSAARSAEIFANLSKVIGLLGGASFIYSALQVG